MRTKMLVIISLVFLSVSTISAQNEKSEKFKVAGNCGMCENRIEKAANSVEGVTYAEWDKETNILEVKFSSDQTDLHKIHMAIAKVGHDTEMHKASDDVYEKLPGCCKYERIITTSGEEEKK
jgi:mercuric ion binding protein